MGVFNQFSCSIIVVFCVLIADLSAQEHDLVVADSILRNLYRVNVVSGTATPLLPANDTRLPFAVAYDRVNKEIFWSNHNGGTINRHSLIGGSGEVIHTSSDESVYGIAMDADRQQIYYCGENNTKGVIGVISRDGSNHRVLVNAIGMKPRAIVLDFPNRLMYWTDSGSRRTVSKANMDTGSQGFGDTIASSRLFISPHALAIDFTVPTMYIGDYARQAIFVSTLTFPGNVGMLYQRTGSFFYAFLFNANNLFITAWENSHLIRVDLTTYTISDQPPSTFNKTCGLTVITDALITTTTEASTLPTEILTALETATTESASTISTRATADESSMNTTASSGAAEATTISTASEYVLVADFALGNLYHVDVIAGTAVPLLPADPLRHPVAVVYDDVNENVFWTDVSSKTINRLTLNRSEDVIYTSNSTESSLNGLAIDVRSQMLYYTEDTGGIGRIGVISTEGNNQRILVQQPDMIPFAIVVDVDNRLMYWTHIGSSPSVKRANMDTGSQAVTITSDYSVRWPRALAINFTEQIMYIGDAYTGGFYNASTSSGSTMLRIFSDSSKVYHSMVLTPSNIFITDWGSRSLLQVDRSISQLSLQPPEMFNVACGISSIGRFNVNPTTPETTSPMTPLTTIPARTEGSDLVVADSILRNLYRLSVSNGTAVPLLPFDSFREPVAVAYDNINGDIFWTDVFRKTINRLSVNGPSRSEEVLYTSTNASSQMNGLAIDVQRQRLYYSDNIGVIGVLSLNENSHRVLIQLDEMEPSAIVLDVDNRLIYWTGAGSTPSVNRANMNSGQQQQRLVSGSQLRWPRALAIDFPNQMMYIGDAFYGTILIATTDGLSLRSVYSDPARFYHSFLLTPSSIYISDWSLRALLRVDREEEVLQLQPPIMFNSTCGIALIDMFTDANTTTQTPTSSEITTATITTLRMLTTSAAATTTETMLDTSPSIFTTATPLSTAASTLQTTVKETSIPAFPSTFTAAPAFSTAASTLQTSRRTSVEDGDLVVADPSLHNLYRLNVDDGTAVPLLSADPSRQPVAVVYDNVNNNIFWTDVARKTINRLSLSSRSESVIYTSTNAASNMSGLAIDVQSQMLYYSDVVGLIGVLSTNGNYSHRVLVQSGTMKPFAVVLDSNSRLIYWTDVGDTPSVNRANMNSGQQQEVLVSGSQLRLPRALAIHFEAQLMFVGDAFYGRILIGRTGGGTLQTIFQEPSLSFHSVILTPNNFFITDWNSRTLIRVNRISFLRTSQAPAIFNQACGIALINQSNSN